MFDLYPRHGHRTPQQIAEDAGGSFEPKKASGRPDRAGVKNQSRGKASPTSLDEGASNRPPADTEPR